MCLVLLLIHTQLTTPSLVKLKTCPFIHSVVFQIGIIGGTGFNDPHLFDERAEKSVTTVFGEVGFSDTNIPTNIL